MKFFLLTWARLQLRLAVVLSVVGARALNAGKWTAERAVVNLERAKNGDIRDTDFLFLTAVALGAVLLVVSLN